MLSAFQSDLDRDAQRLPADSGATVPDSHRLPAHADESALLRGRIGVPAYRSAVILRLCALAALVTALAACGYRTTTVKTIAVVNGPVKRVVTLVPSMAEDLFAVGAGNAVVGVSAYSDAPPQAKQLPQIATFASISSERIVALHPDLAVGIVSQDRLVADLRRAGIQVLLLHDDSYADIFNNLVALGTVTGHADAALSFVRQLHARTAAILRTVKPRARKPSVFVVLGTAPIFTVGRGSYIDSLIAMAGGRNAAADISAPYARYSAEALVARQPDVLIADPDIHLNDVLNRAPWTSLRAVREHRLYVLPDAAILERPGPRYNEGLAWLVATLGRVST
jgi:iron complex transport system substrate-binding protein